MNSQSLYEVLGVEPTASTEAIKTAYRELAKRYHPDTHPGHPEYEEVLKDITSAYGVLGTGKNASDIRVIMDIVAYLGHSTQFDEFIILSADADFTPVILKLREHDRRSVIFDNGKTASAYRTAADGFVDMDALVEFLEKNDEKKVSTRSRDGGG